MKTRNIVIDLSGKRPGVWMADGPVDITFVRSEDDSASEPEDFEYVGEYQVFSDWSTQEEVQDFTAGVKEFGRDSADDSNGVVDGEDGEDGEDSADDSDGVFGQSVPEGYVCVVMHGDDGGVYNIPGDYSEIDGNFLHVFDSTDPKTVVDGAGIRISVSEASFPIANVEAIIRG